MPEWSLSDIPGSVVLRAQQDADFAVRLLHRESRRDALGDDDLGLTDEQQRELFPILDEIAQLSFRDAIRMLRDQGSVVLD
jgi:hypothetical protein